MLDALRRAMQLFDDGGPFLGSHRLRILRCDGHDLFDACHHVFDLLIHGIDHMVRRPWVDAHATLARPEPDACLMPECPDPCAKTRPRTSHELLGLPGR